MEPNLIGFANPLKETLLDTVVVVVPKFDPDVAPLVNPVPTPVTPDPPDKLQVLTWAYNFPIKVFKLLISFLAFYKFY